MLFCYALKRFILLRWSVSKLRGGNRSPRRMGQHHKIAVVGLLDTAVKESKDRVTSAITNSGLCWPYGQRIAINWHRRMSGRKDPASISRSLSACSSWRKTTDCLFSMRSASRVNWLYRGNCARWRESYRLPWKPSVGTGKLSSCLSTMPRKPVSWRASTSMGHVRFRMSCISCAAISPWIRCAQSTAGPTQDRGTGTRPHGHGLFVEFPDEFQRLLVDERAVRNPRDPAEKMKDHAVGRAGIVARDVYEGGVW
jgi:hypothetical protein